MIKIDRLADILSGIELFGSIPKEPMKRILETSNYRIKGYLKDEVIHLQNEVCHAVDLILEGQVCVQKIDENGNVLTISVFSAGETIGANLIFAHSNVYPMTVAARLDALVLSLQKETIIKLCQNSSGFLSRFLTAVSDRTLVLAGKIDKISMKTIRQRITDFLTYEYSIQQSTVIQLNMYKKDLAERLGIPRSSLGRELAKMRRDGLIEFDAKTITLRKIQLGLAYNPR